MSKATTSQENVASAGGSTHSIARILYAFGVLLGTCALFWRPLVAGSVPYEYNNLFVRLFWLIGALFMLCARCFSGNLSWRSTKANALVILFIVAHGLSFGVAKNIYASEELIKNFIFSAIFLLTAYNTLSITALRRLILFTVASSVIVHIYGLHQYYVSLDLTREAIQNNPAFQNSSGVEKQMFLSRLNTNEVFATFITPNAYGIYIAMLLPLCFIGFGVAIKTGAVLGMVAWGALVMLACWNFSLTGSKGAYIAMAMAAGVWVLTQIYRVIRHKGVALTVITVLCVIGIGAGVAALSAHEGASLSLQVRWQYWVATAHMIADYPVLGVGAGNFGDYYPQYKTLTGWEVQKVHNDYLQVLCETGFLGFMAFLGLRVLPLVGWFSAQRQSPSESSEHSQPGATTQPIVPLSDLATPLLYAGACFGFCYVLVMGVLGFETYKALLTVGSFGAFVVVCLGITQSAQQWQAHHWRHALGWGLVILGVHHAVDFDLYVPTLFMLGTLFSLVLCAETNSQWRQFPLKDTQRSMALMLCFLVAGAVYWTGLFKDFRISHVLGNLYTPYNSPPPDVAMTNLLKVQELVAHNEFAQQRLHQYGANLYRRGQRQVGDQPLKALILSSAQNAIDANPRKASNYVQLAEYKLHFDGNQALVECIALYKNAVALYPLRPQTRLRLSQLLWKAKRKEEAVATIEEALAMNERITDERTRLSHDAKRKAQEFLDEYKK